MAEERSSDYQFSEVVIGMSCRASWCSYPTLIRKRLQEKETCSWPKYKSTSPCKCVACALCEAGRVRQGCGGESAGTCVDCEAGKYREAGMPNECLPCASCEAGKFRDSC
eukprot:3918472-Rhodomonas_salina.1